MIPLNPTWGSPTVANYQPLSVFNPSQQAYQQPYNYQQQNSRPQYNYQTQNHTDLSIINYQIQNHRPQHYNYQIQNGYRPQYYQIQNSRPTTYQIQTINRPQNYEHSIIDLQQEQTIVDQHIMKNYT